MLFWLGRPGQTGLDDPPAIIEDQPFPADAFFLAFDLDKSGWITPEEFREAYARAATQKDRPFQFSKGPGKPALNHVEAFASLDVNHDEKIDRDDMQVAFDKAWLKFKVDRAAQGLEARIWRKEWLTFNPHQMAALNLETGAESRKELPFGGAYFVSKYFAARRYVSLAGPDGETLRGFLWEDRVNGRVHLLCGDATIKVFDPAGVKVTDMPDAPQLEFIDDVQRVSWEDPADNLKLARRCVELGLTKEAEMMYGRVLIFEPGNKEALDALGLRKEGPMFVPKGG
jgi:hypothetical protein